MDESTDIASGSRPVDSSGLAQFAEVLDIEDHSNF
jgi:hypothetical protein